MREDKPRLLVVTQVRPFPGSSGQQQRVRYTLDALRERYEVSVLTTADAAERADVQAAWLEHCDAAHVMPARYSATPLHRMYHKVVGEAYALGKALKLSNYRIGRVELTPERVRSYVGAAPYDLVLFEYWHAYRATHVFRDRGIPCVLDTHNVLAHSYPRHLDRLPVPAALKVRWQRRYQAHEVRAWNHFDALIAINEAERQYIEEHVDPGVDVFFAPMGIDLTQWPYRWTYRTPPVVAYYGGLGSRHNQESAWQCYHEVMPPIWARHPEAQFWIVGSSPPDDLQQLAQDDDRVRVTGFVEHVPDVLGEATVVVCPWTGRYGFRSRLVEVMALGIPVVTTPDAVHGMQLQDGEGLVLTEGPSAMATQALRILDDADEAHTMSRGARACVEEHYDVQQTYGRLAREVVDWNAVQSVA
ncbi:MAG: glycosyltransferase [Bacteroidetes bacterium]|jgi:glycosyltransferase involved in cell wall biosynthesis|nr:glycosyltransferase [Bacteroidota bacterium]